MMAVAMRNVRCSVILRGAVLVAVASFACGEGLAQGAAARLAESGRADLRAAVEELARVREEIAGEQLPLARRVRELEDALIEKRRALQVEERAAENRLVDLNVLKADVDFRQEEANYLSGLLSEYRRVFETRIHIGEVQRYQDGITAAAVAADSAELSVREKLVRQAAIVETALDRVDALIGGDAFEGRALNARGVMQSGRYVLAGPVAVFASADGMDAGLVQLELGSPEPKIVDLGEGLAPGIRSLADGGEGMLPVDATLGNALKIAATEDDLITHISKGGVVMVPIIGLGLVALLTGLLKWIQLSRIRLAGPRDLQVILSHLEDRDEKGAAAHAARIPGMVGDLLKAAVEHCREKKEYIEEVMYERMLSAKPRLERFLPIVALTAATAPLLGLLGTVTGMINTFNMITVFGTGDPRRLSAGISEALITTKFGLVVAVPALIIHAFLSRKAKGILGSMEQTTVGFLNAVPEPDGGEDNR